MVSTIWALESTDKDALRKLVGPPGDALSEIDVSKHYGSDSTTWNFKIDDAATVRHLLSTSSLHAEEREALASHATVKSLSQALSALGGSATERHKQLLSVLATSFKRGSATLAVIDLLSPRMPEFVYFSQYQRMDGRVPLQTLNQKKQNGQPLSDSEQTFVHFCEFAGSSLDELASITRFESLIAKFEAASNKITDQIFKYWTQNKNLTVLFSRDPGLSGDPVPFNTGLVFNIRIKNEIHKVSVPFDDRSAGFVWFFSFLVLFSQLRKSHGDNLLLLLDEPGLTLHGKAQGDLLRFIKEQLAPKHQVIYTTHSPFMIPPEELLSVRTVEDVVHTDEKGTVLEVKGTKVGSDVLSVDRDTLFPLQAALGYDITQTLFVGKNTLLVEGPSDLLYLKFFSDRLRELNRAHLHPAWVICPVGGLDKVSAFLSLFGAHHLNVAVLVDVATGQKKKAEDLRRLSDEILKTGHVFPATRYVNQDEADIEDLLGRTTYVALVNNCYHLTDKDAIAAPPPSRSARIVTFIEDEMRLRPRAPEFDHYHPAEYLVQHRADLLASLPDVDAGLDRFQKFFEELNQVVASPG